VRAAPGGGAEAGAVREDGFRLAAVEAIAMVLAIWMRGASESRTARFERLADAERWARGAMASLSLEVERCHVRILDGVPTPWTTVRTIAHWTKARGAVGFELVAGEPLEDRAPETARSLRALPQAAE
jgi:hypothetical protein